VEEEDTDLRRAGAVKSTSGVVCRKTTSGVVCPQVWKNWVKETPEVIFWRCHLQIFPYVLIERVFIHEHRSALYNTGLMTK
jgi:hypothetical protein